MKNFTRLFFFCLGFFVLGIAGVKAQSSTSPAEKATLVPRSERVYSIKEINANYQKKNVKKARTFRSTKELKKQLSTPIKTFRRSPNKSVKESSSEIILKKDKNVRELIHEIKSPVRP